MPDPEAGAGQGYAPVGDPASIADIVSGQAPGTPPEASGVAGTGVPVATTAGSEVPEAPGVDLSSVDPQIMEAVQRKMEAGFTPKLQEAAQYRDMFPGMDAATARAELETLRATQSLYDSVMQSVDEPAARPEQPGALLPENFADLPASEVTAAIQGIVQQAVMPYEQALTRQQVKSDMQDLVAKGYNPTPDELKVCQQIWNRGVTLEEALIAHRGKQGIEQRARQARADAVAALERTSAAQVEGRTAPIAPTAPAGVEGDIMAAIAAGERAAGVSWDDVSPFDSE